VKAEAKSCGNQRKEQQVKPFKTIELGGKDYVTSNV
jgi:hypothetical protein